MEIARELEVENRLTRLEAMVTEMKATIDQVKPQLILLNMVGSSFGGVVTGVILWWLTKK